MLTDFHAYTKSQAREEKFREIIFCSPKEFSNFETQAAKITSTHFRNKREIFNPIYLSNVCINDCSYCGFRKSLSNLKRVTLNTEQSVQEAQFLISRGVRNWIILAGEYPEPHYSRMLIEHIAQLAKLDCRWMGIEVAALETSQYRTIAKLGVKYLILFQETYNEQLYSELHGSDAPKSDFQHRYETPFRAIEAGFEEIGLGVLYGTGDWLSEAVGMIHHADRIAAFKPDIKLSFSYVVLQPYNQQENELFKEKMNSEIGRRIFVALRLLFPKARLLLSARESQQFRLDNLDVLTTIGEAGSSSVGGYTVFPDPEERNAQFKISGRNQLDILKQKMKSLGYEIA